MAPLAPRLLTQVDLIHEREGEGDAVGHTELGGKQQTAMNE